MDGFAGSNGQAREEASGQGLTGETRFIRLLRVGLGVVGFSPWVATWLRPLVSARAGELIYFVFAPVCHNRPSRTLVVAGVLMPLCSRCLGIFGGFVTAALVPRPRWGIGASLGYGFVASVLMVADVVTQDLGMHPVWHWMRILTGVIWGHVCGLGVLAVGRWIEKTVMRRSSSQC